MRVLVISNFYPPIVRGGYELLCADVVDRLRDRDEVLVLTSRSSEPVAAEPHVVRELDVLVPGKRTTLTAPLATVRAVRTTRRILREFRPELVFVWNGTVIPQAAIRVAETAGVPVVYSIAEHWFARLYLADPFMRYLRGERGLRALWGVVIRLVNRHPGLRLELERKVPASLMWISEALRRSVRVPPTIEPLVERVIYPGPGDPDLWLGLERRPPSQPPTIAFVGRIEEQKGPSVAYRALAALRDHHGIDAQLKLAGRGSPTKLLLLERLAKELGIEERVELLGHLDRAGVGSLLAGSSALLVPSTWQEPFGLVLVEAALARVPVVGSRSGGMPEALEEDAHALFFPIGDAAACADALARVLTDAPDTEARTARAFEHARRLSSDGYARQARELLSAGVAAHERHLEEHTSNEPARPGRGRSRAADAGVNLALFLIPR